MITETMTVADFVAFHSITLKTTKIPFRADGADDGDRWHKDASHYACELTRPGLGATETVRFFYSQGSGIKGRPQAADALDSLKADASSAADDFESWADEYGYDTDSRKAYATWEACRKVRRDLIAFLGHALYRELEAAESL